MPGVNLLPQNVQEAYLNDPQTQLALAMMKQGTSDEPIRTPMQGLGHLAQALAGTYSNYKQRQRYGQVADQQNQMLMQALARQQGGDMRADSPMDPQLLQLANQGVPLANTIVGNQLKLSMIGPEAKAKAEAELPSQEHLKQMEIDAANQRNTNTISAEDARAAAARDAEWKRLQYSEQHQDKRWDQLHSADPATVEATAQAVANYQMKPPSTVAMKSPVGLQIMARARQINPNYDAAKYDAHVKMEGGFTQGKQGQAIASINKSVEHLAQLESAVDALNNGNIPALNAIGNQYGVQTGGDAVTTFNTIRKVVGGEIVRSITNGGTGGDREEFNTLLSPNASPAQIKGSIAALRHLMSGQASGYRQEWKSGGGTEDEFNSRFLSPTTRAAIEAGGASAQPAQPASAIPQGWSVQAH